MSDANKSRTIPVWALLLDVVGTLVLAAGIYTQVVDTGMQRAGIAMIITGALLMVPLVLVVVARAASNT